VICAIGKKTAGGHLRWEIDQVVALWETVANATYIEFAGGKGLWPAGFGEEVGECEIKEMGRCGRQVVVDYIWGTRCQFFVERTL
jgi:hypothetical protein